MPDARTGARVAPVHEQLLRAALGPPERTVGEWDELRRRRSELWDPPTSRLLPLLARALLDAGVDGADVRRLEQTASHAWLANELLFRRAGVALDALAAARVRTMALKGVPLVLRHYGDPSLRPMADFDLLVDEDAAPDAIAALRGAGWTLDWTIDPDFVARTAEVPCRSPNGAVVLDLHWRLVPWVGRSARLKDPALWESATPLAVGGHVTLGPAPHDLLLQVILHAFRSGWTEVPRWVADAVVLLRSTATLNWDAFVDRVVESHLVLPVADALHYVASSFGAPVPDAVLEALTEARPTRRELRKYHVAQQPTESERHALLGDAPDLRTSWARSSVNYTRLGALQSLGPFLRGRMHVDRVWALPFAVTARRVRRARSAGRPAASP